MGQVGGSSRSIDEEDMWVEFQVGVGGYKAVLASLCLGLSVSFGWPAGLMEIVATQLGVQAVPSWCHSWRKGGSD